MPEGYLHLTCEQRCQIYALLQSGRSQAHIARQIGVDPSTISRELVRNTGARGYRFKQAHEKASQRRQEASVRIPAIAITCSDASRSGIPIDREQCGVGA